MPRGGLQDYLILSLANILQKFVRKRIGVRQEDGRMAVTGGINMTTA